MESLLSCCVDGFLQEILCFCSCLAVSCYVMENALQSDICYCCLPRKALDRASRDCMDRTLPVASSVIILSKIASGVPRSAAVKEAVDAACAAGRECDVASVRWL